jgi:hypothetical protein
VASYSYPVYYPAYYPAYYPSYSCGLPVTVSYAAPAYPIYYTTPLFCNAVVTVPAPVALTTGPIYAVPTPAPPSSSGKPVPPRVSEARSGNGGESPKSTTVPVRERVQVGFWNVSGRDLTLTVDGQRRVLPRNRSITLSLGRQFVWQVDERTAQNEDIPAGNSTLEIVLRR